jgi:hypothetical protein
MKAVKGIIVELQNKVLTYNGVAINYDFITKTATTASLIGLEIVSDFDAPLWCPDRGVVVHSDDEEILVGDLVILEYFAVVRKLGTSIERHQKSPHDIYEVVDGKVHIPIRTKGENYVYAVFRNGEFIPYNGFEVVEVIKEKDNAKIYTMHLNRQTQKLSEDYATDRCRVMYGEYKGMTCIFNPSYLLGEAQKSIIDGREVRFIQKEYVLAQLN